MRFLKIGDWTIDRTDGSLVSASGVARLEPRVMAVLLRLAESGGAVVSQDELLQDVWRDTHVAPGALARTIFLLRQALGDDVRKPRYIQTVPKRGYRLIAAVGEVGGAPPRTRPRWRPAAGLAAAVSLSIVALADDVARMPGRGGVERRQTNQTRLGNENAFAYFTRAVAMDPSSANAHAGLSTAYSFRANYLPDRARWATVAIDEATRATALDARSAGAVRALATAHFQAGHFREAVTQYRRALAMDPNDYATNMNLGLVAMTSGRVAEGMTIFERQLAAAPERSATYAYLARGLIQTRYTREAVQMARAAVVLEPYSFEAQLVLVRADLLAAQYDGARARLERLLEVRADCAQCIVQLGLIEELTGRPDRAEERYRAARAMDGRYPAIGLRLARLAGLAGRTSEFEALVQEIEDAAREDIRRGSEDQRPSWLLAVGASLRGDRASAIRWYRQAVASGRRDAPWDLWEPMFAAVQSDPDFLALLQPARVEREAVAPIAQRIPQALEAIDKRLGGTLLLDADAADPPGWSSGR